MLFASILDSLQDVSSLAFAVLAFAALFLLLEGLDRVVSAAGWLEIASTWRSSRRSRRCWAATWRACSAASSASPPRPRGRAPHGRPGAGLEALRALRADLQRGVLGAALPDPAHPGDPPVQPARVRLGAVGRRVQHHVVVRDQHELAVLRRRDDDVELLADGRPGRPELRLGGGRHRGRDRADPRHRRALGHLAGELLRRPLPRAAVRAAADLGRRRPVPRDSRACRSRSTCRSPPRRPSRSSAPTAAASSTSTRRTRSRTPPGSRTSSRCC